MFGLGFTEIMIIAIVAILFLGPDKLPSTMVDIAKFFRNVKNTVGTVKESLEQEINVSEIKEEALAYKKELLEAQEKVSQVTDYADDIVENNQLKEETVTFKKKESKNV